MIALVLAGVLAGAPARVAEHRLEYIPLRHCTADELLPILRPIVEGEGSILAAGAPPRPSLAARASPARLRQVRDVVLALDLPPRPLRLSIRQGARHALHAFDGFETWIPIKGEAAPDAREAVASADGVAVSDDWWAQALAGGFSLVPRVEDDGRVSIHVRTRTVTEARPRERGSTIGGRLGEWIEIGLLLEEHARDHAGPRFEPDRGRRLESSVEVMVQTLR